jgi:hypothetical protein
MNEQQYFNHDVPLRREDWEQAIDLLKEASQHLEDAIQALRMYNDLTGDQQVLAAVLDPIAKMQLQGRHLEIASAHWERLLNTD